MLSMKAVLFFLAIGIVVFAAFYYMRADIEFDLDNPYCTELQEKLDNDPGFSMSYGERVKAVWKGCI